MHTCGGPSGVPRLVCTWNKAARALLTHSPHAFSWAPSVLATSAPINDGVCRPCTRWLDIASTAALRRPRVCPGTRASLIPKSETTCGVARGGRAP